MDAIRDSLDRLFDEQNSYLDPTGSLAALARLMHPSVPACLLIATADAQVRAVWSADAALPHAVAKTLAAELASRLDGEDWCTWPVQLAGQSYFAFALRLGEAAEGGILGGLVAPGETLALATLPPLLAVAGEMAWRAVALQRQIDEMQTHIRHLQAEHETLAVAHTDAMVSAIEEQERRLEEERERLAMERAYVATEAANRAKNQFLAHMSHEIRTPLNAILGFTELLRKGADQGDETERQEYLDTIYNSTTHLLELINDILDLSKIEAGQMKIERIACAPSEIVANVMTALRVRAEQKRLRFACQWQGEVPATIQTDPLRVKQLLLNLVGNAVKFTSHGEVRLVVSLVDAPSRPKLRFDVIDTGIGIAPDKLECVFDAFVQGDSSITREFGGTGLGLAISRRIARALGGEITVQSELGRGSVFTATIETGPLDGVSLVSPASETTSPKPSSHVARPQDLSPARVLVVEDGVTNRKLLRLILERSGAQVTLAENGEQGVQRALAQPFDVILMDMQMPVMDGYTATRRLREQGLQTPIIALTAHAMAGDERKCLEAGCSNYLSKPIEADQLLQCVAGYLAEPVSVSSPPTPLPRNAPPASQLPQEALISSLPGDDPDFREIIVEFVERLQMKLTAMEEALRTGDFESLAELAHWLKGSGGTAGFADFTEPARRLEQLAKQRQAAQARQQFAAIYGLASRIVTPALEAKEQNP
jgi:signal transduction histidine kinase/CheY-like chemotaxis protein/HPt (histidine-containing phosphotransfer) domain-containing protein